MSLQVDLVCKILSETEYDFSKTIQPECFPLDLMGDTRSGREVLTQRSLFWNIFSIRKSPSIPEGMHSTMSHDQCNLCVYACIDRRWRNADIRVFLCQLLCSASDDQRLSFTSLLRPEHGGPELPCPPSQYYSPYFGNSDDRRLQTELEKVRVALESYLSLQRVWPGSDGPDLRTRWPAMQAGCQPSKETLKSADVKIRISMTIVAAVISVNIYDSFSFKLPTVQERSKDSARIPHTVSPVLPAAW